jgi:hypothetical protein
VSKRFYDGARTAELLRLSGITPAQVNMFTRAGMDSLVHLQGCTATALGELIADWNDSGSAPPSAGALDQWALEINTTPSLVPNLPSP